MALLAHLMEEIVKTTLNEEEKSTLSPRQCTVSLATTSFLRSDNFRIPSRKNDASFEAIHELINFLTSS